jgi:hypothetical protein
VIHPINVWTPTMRNKTCEGPWLSCPRLHGTPRRASPFLLALPGLSRTSPPTELRSHLDDFDQIGSDVVQSVRCGRLSRLKTLACLGGVVRNESEEVVLRGIAIQGQRGTSSRSLGFELAGPRPTFLRQTVSAVDLCPSMLALVPRAVVHEAGGDQVLQ